MTDTQRSIAAIISLLPDNTEGLITAQVLRDLVVSLKTGHGEMYLSTPATTTFVAPSTFYKVLGITTLSMAPVAINWDMPLDNRMRYTGAAPRVVKVSCTCTITRGGGANILAALRLAKNGVTQTDSETLQFLNTSGEQQNVTLTGLFEILNNDYIELFIANNSNTNDIDVTSISLDVLSFPA